MKKCEHILALEALMKTLGIRVWAERAEEPAGWVNISCHQCGIVVEDVLGEDRGSPRSPS